MNINFADLWERKKGLTEILRMTKKNGVWKNHLQRVLGTSATSIDPAHTASPHNRSINQSTGLVSMREEICMLLTSCCILNSVITQANSQFVMNQINHLKII